MEILLIVIAVLLSMLVTRIYTIKTAPVMGTLKIDQSKDDKDLFMIEIDNMQGMMNKKHVTLNVVKTNKLVSMNDTQNKQSL